MPYIIMTKPSSDSTSEYRSASWPGWYTNEEADAILLVNSLSTNPLVYIKKDVKEKYKVEVTYSYIVESAEELTEENWRRAWTRGGGSAGITTRITKDYSP